MKVLRIPCCHKKDVLPALKRNFSVLSGYDNIGLVSTAQHVKELDSLKKFIESSGKKALIGGQVLGCNQHNAIRIEKKVDAFLYVGSGLFHPLGISVKSSKPVFMLNPYSEELAEVPAIEKEKWLKRQRGRLMKAIEADFYGILVSTKSGQYNLKKAFEVKKKLESKGKKALIFAGEELSPSNLLPFDVDCWVNTACPRLADDKFEKSIINAEELQLI